MKVKKIACLVALALCGHVFANGPGEAGEHVFHATKEEAMKAAGLDVYDTPTNRERGEFISKNREKILDYLGELYAGEWVEYDEKGDRYQVIAITREVKSDVPVFSSGYYKFIYKKYNFNELSHLSDFLEDAFMTPGKNDFGLLNSIAVGVKVNKVRIEVSPFNEWRVKRALNYLGVDFDMIELLVIDDPYELSSSYYAGARIFTKMDGVLGGWRCTGGFVGNKGIYHLLLTSGHCLTEGKNKVYFDSGAGVAGDFIGDFLGGVFGGALGMDYAVFSNANFVHDVRSGIMISPSRIRRVKPPLEVMSEMIGNTVCSQGGVSGWRCGVIYEVNSRIMAGGVKLRHFAKADFCSVPGDSGGPVVSSGDNALGIQSATSHNCGASFGGGVGKRRVSAFQPIMPVIRQIKGFNLWTN